MAKSALVTPLSLGAGSPDLGEIQSRIRSGRTEGHFYVALLGLRTYEPLPLDRQVRKGLAYSTFARFQRNTGLPAGNIAELIQIPTRTLSRRRSEGKFAPEESDRLVRAARVFGRAMELFDGDGDAARVWLTARQPALGGRAPLELARTDVGAGEVESLIGRLEHGIPS
ncbi:MAG TPA: antitoxin Xre/MbcA/ParS toxin-binding domain-containing protein [Gemmatimonadales bacterium]|nr:antitoxin Xre/MbcA/ParS toxin-binding domain-containing protein [Gemmatimonadales bacterium]